MFAKLSAVALLIQFAAGLQLTIPKDPVSAGSVTINWTKEPSDDVFSLYLFNEIFHNSFAIANNVNPADETITLTLPVVPDGDGYTLAAVNVANVNDVYTRTASFYIAPNPATTGTTSSTSVASSSATATLTVSNTASSAASGSSTTAPASSSSGFGVTVKPSSTSGSSSAASSSSAISAAPSGNNGNGAASFGANTFVAFAAAVVGAVIAF